MNTDEVYERALRETGGACDTHSNPHSYACTDWNFQGNGLFPWFKMNWKSLQGAWFSVTYVRPTSGRIDCANGLVIRGGENNDCEFSMSTNPDRPTQPMGIINSASGQQMGQMIISRKTVSWDNWLGQTRSSNPRSFEKLDDYTVRFEMNEYNSPYSHRFTCRDFNRNNNHHLLCKWEMLFPGSDRWVEKGYMGYLTQEVWDGFIRGNH